MRADLPPLVITAALNETTVNDANPSFPYSPAQLVDQAILARRAGASVVHFHARDPRTRELSLDCGVYAEIYAGLRRETDLLLEPGLGLIADPPQRRIEHLTSIEPALRPDFAPVEMGAFNVDFWDPARRRFASGDALYDLTRERIQGVLEALAAAGYRAAASCWDLGQLRTARCFREMGLLPERTLWEFTFTGDVVPSGAAPTLPALRAMLDEIPPGEPWSVGCWNGDVLPIAAIAIVLGGHVRIGLGDYAYERLGAPDHADLVGRVAELARIVGRDIASPAQARELLGLGS
jgi:uncharacterized protein (DUF849 family)